MGLKVTNNAFGTLNASINSSATTIVLVAGQGARFPTLSAGDYFYATLIDTSNNLEIVKCTARSTDTLTVVRGQDSTTARAYATNDRFELRPTAVLLTEVITAAEGALPKAGGTMTGALVTNGLTNRMSSFNQLTTEVTNDNQVGLKIARTGGTNIVSWEIYNASGDASKALRIYGGGLDRVFIDDSGRVRMPYQPAFRATEPTAADGANVSFASKDSAFTGRDAGFSTSTGLFTAPVAGVYVFSFAFLHGSGGSASYVRTLFKLNGSSSTTYGDTLEDWGSSYKFTSMSMAFRLSANDTVGLVCEGRKIYDTSYGCFSGFLIG